MEGDSTDDTYAELERLAASVRPEYRQVIVVRHPQGVPRDREDRSAPSLQRRSNERAESRLCFFHFFDQRRDHLEQVRHHAVVGDLEDRRVGVLVDGHDAA